MPVRRTRSTCARAILVACLLSLAPAGSLGGDRAASERSPREIETTPSRLGHGVLRLISEAPRSLDPAEADSIYESLPLNQIFNGLVSLDASMNVLPCLASTWTVSRDGTIYTVRLRSGVTFHDGSPFTADDVVFTFRRLLDPKRHQRNIACSYLEILEGAKAYGSGARSDLPGVVAVDRETVRITLTRPYFSFLQVLAMDGLKIVPRQQIERIGDEAFARAPAGTGVFQLSSWSTQHLRLTANPAFFGEKSRLQGVDIHFFEPGESDEGLQRFLEGSIDAVDIPTSQEGHVRQQPGVRITRTPELSLTFLGLGTRHRLLQDGRIRRAIAHAIDVRRLVRESPLFRRAALGIVPPGLQGYSPESKILTYDPDASRRLLAEAGYAGGKGLPAIDLYCNSSSASAARTAADIQSDLGAVGIPVEVRPVSWNELSARIDRNQAPLFMLTWLADLPDPDSFLRTLFESEGSNNYFRLRDEEVQQLLTAGAAEMNPIIRAGIYRRAEHRILELAPLVPLYHPVTVLATRANVRGLEPGPLGLTAVDLSKVRIVPNPAGAASGRDAGESR